MSARRQVCPLVESGYQSFASACRMAELLQAQEGIAFVVCNEGRRYLVTQRTNAKRKRLNVVATFERA